MKESKFQFSMARGNLSIAKRCLARVGKGNAAYNVDMAMCALDHILAAQKCRELAKAHRATEKARGW